MAEQPKDEAEYSWQEIAQHNTVDSAWVYCDDEVFDITHFLSKHPGGVDMLLLFAGRDISTVLPMYHPFTNQPRRLLESMRIGKLKHSTSEHGSFLKSDKNKDLYDTLRSRVGAYFAENGIDYKDARPGLMNMAAMLTGMYSAWWFAWTANDHHLLIRVFCMMIAGVFQGLLLVHTMHDCSHCALSHHPWMWKWIGRFCLDIACGNSFDAWLHQHVVGHHIYTNMVTVDPDCPSTLDNDVRRIMPAQEWSVTHSYQYIWLPIVYCVYAFKSRVQDLSETLFRAQNGSMRVNPRYMDTESLIMQVLAKSLWLFRQVILPLIILKCDVLSEWIPLLLSMELSTGYFLTFNFQVSHVSTDVQWPLMDEETNQIPCIWADMQVACSVDYSHDSEWNTLMSGALNYQSIHHLFPSVSQYHYPCIAPIIRQTCKEFSIEFNHLPSFTHAFSAHIRQLYLMSFPPHSQ